MMKEITAALIHPQDARALTHRILLVLVNGIRLARSRGRIPGSHTFAKTGLHI